MTSSSASSQFRLTLMRIANLLTEEDVKNVAFICKDISPARRDKLSNGVELFAALQGRDVIGEENVDTLIEWLDELGLLEASKLLKEYCQKYIKGGNSQQKKCLIHEDLPLKYFCISCDSKICPDCAYTSHNQVSHCDVINLDQLKVELTTRKMKFDEEVDRARAAIESTENLWRKKKDFLAECRNITRERTIEDYLKSLQAAEKKKREALETVNANEIADMKQLLGERKTLESLRNDIDLLKSRSNDPTDYSLHELKQITRATKNVSEIKIKIEEQGESVKTDRSGIVYRDGGNKGAFGIVVLFAGTVGLGAQLLHAFDKRHGRGGVELVCIDSTEQTVEYWRHTVVVTDHRSPVVMSHVDLWHAKRNHVLFAVGNSVFVIHPHNSGSRFDYVQSETRLEIGEVPEGSWITSIAAHNLSIGNASDCFLISMHNNSTVCEYDISGRSVRSIDLKKQVSPARISCAAYYDNIFAVITTASDSVQLLSVTKGTVKKCGSLRSPFVNLVPAIVISTGVNWIVLFVGVRGVKQWGVAHYDTTGETMKVCEKGVSTGNDDVPVSIARWRGKGYVTLSDKTVRTFQY